MRGLTSSRRPLQNRQARAQHPARRSCEELARHDQALDLVCALIDLGDLGVAVEALDLDAADVAHAAVDLDSVRGMRDGGVRREAFGHRAFEAGGLAAV